MRPGWYSGVLKSKVGASRTVMPRNFHNLNCGQAGVTRISFITTAPSVPQNGLRNFEMERCIPKHATSEIRTRRKNIEASSNANLNLN